MGTAIVVHEIYGLRYCFLSAILYQYFCSLITSLENKGFASLSYRARGEMTGVGAVVVYKEHSEAVGLKK